MSAIPPASDLEILRMLADTHTTVGVEEAVACLLGAGEDAASAAVTALASAGSLEVGLAVHALVLAARRGTDARGAIAAIADGESPPKDWSDFEVRVAAEEAEEDVASALSFTQRSGRAVVRGGAPARSAVAAVRAGVAELVVGAWSGHRHDGIPLTRAVIEHRWAHRLAKHAQLAVRLRAADEGPDAAAEATLHAVNVPADARAPGRTGAPWALDGAPRPADPEVLTRAQAYIDLLPPL